MRRRLPPPAQSDRVRRVLDRLGLATVCTGARCPNLCECFASGTATFLILGTACTRSCGFCAVGSGAPDPVRPDEPEAVAQAAAELGLAHVVVTSVTRDDLADGGAAHFARTIAEVRRRCPGASVEVLTPDFRGDPAALDVVLQARPDVLNHNVETVPRLYAQVRPQADYRRSLELLRQARLRAPARLRLGEARLPRGGAGWSLRTKSGLMLGLGETPAEVRGVLADLRSVGCDVVTIGQYLQPSPAQVPVRRFVPPEEFRRWERHCRQMGFAAAPAGPYVRSSYHARGVLEGLGR